MTHDGERGRGGGGGGGGVHQSHEELAAFATGQAVADAQGTQQHLVACAACREVAAAAFVASGTSGATVGETLPRTVRSEPQIVEELLARREVERQGRPLAARRARRQAGRSPRTLGAVLLAAAAAVVVYVTGQRPAATAPEVPIPLPQLPPAVAQAPASPGAPEGQSAAVPSRPSSLAARPKEMSKDEALGRVVVPADDTTGARIKVPLRVGRDSLVVATAGDRLPGEAADSAARAGAASATAGGELAATRSLRERYRDMVDRAASRAVSSIDERSGAMASTRYVAVRAGVPLLREPEDFAQVLATLDSATAVESLEERRGAFLKVRFGSAIGWVRGSLVQRR
jgi:hypothetical protein